MPAGPEGRPGRPGAQVKMAETRFCTLIRDTAEIRVTGTISLAIDRCFPDIAAQSRTQEARA